MQHSKLYRMIRTFGLVAVFALTASSLTMPSCAYVFEGLGITLQGKTPWTARPHGRFEKLEKFCGCVDGLATLKSE
jgi:hypothetical protein